MDLLRRLAVPVLLVVIVVGVVVGLRRADDDVGLDPSDEGGTATEQPSADGLALGETAELPDGGAARLNGLEVDAELDPSFPQPEDGFRVDRIDVEACAGSEELFVEPSLWMGLDSDGAVRSAHLGIHGLVSLTIAPGACQRGTVDLAVPEDGELREVLLADEEQKTVARWAVSGEPPERLAPLPSAVEAAEVGTTFEMVGGDTATVTAVATAGDGLEVSARVCAGEFEIPAVPRSWLLVTDDHRMLVPDDPGLSQPIPPQECVEITPTFSVADDAQPIAVVFAYGGAVEEGRWEIQ